jgi:hypothetical protein
MLVPRCLQSVATTLVVLFCLAVPAAAQTGRASGTVRDQNGKPIRSAIIRADSPGSYPAQVTATSDDKGRWAMLGLGGGEWRFTAEAPGYVPQNASIPVRTVGTPPLAFVLLRDPGPLPGALDKNIQQQVAGANTLRDQGRFDQAIAAYLDIHSKNQKLTSIHFLLADAYRRKAAVERDPATKRSLLLLAIDAYDELLKDDAANDRAKAELESTRAEAARSTNGSNR